MQMKSLSHTVKQSKQCNQYCFSFVVCVIETTSWFPQMMMLVHSYIQLKHLLSLSEGFCLFDCQANLKTAKEAQLSTADMLRETKELIWRIKSQNSASEKVTAGYMTHTKQLHAWKPAGAEWHVDCEWIRFMRRPFTMSAHTHTATVAQHKRHTLGCADTHTTGGFMEHGE